MFYSPHMFCRKDQQTLVGGSCPLKNSHDFIMLYLRLQCMLNTVCTFLEFPLFFPQPVPKVYSASLSIHEKELISIPRKTGLKNRAINELKQASPSGPSQHNKHLLISLLDTRLEGIVFINPMFENFSSITVDPQRFYAKTWRYIRGFSHVRLGLSCLELIQGLAK